MATESDLEALIDGVAQAVEAGLRYFEGPGATSTVVVGEWGPREVLSHCVLWHEVTVKGMESVAGGGEPFPADATVDEMNARAVAGLGGRDMSRLADEVRRLQERLVRVARALTDLDAPVVVRHEGGYLSGRERLEVIARHWRGHVSELESAARA